MTDFAPIISRCFVASVEHAPELESTNDRAKQLVEATELPLLVICDRQTRGRGRGNNRWWSAAGALTFSLLLEPDGIPLQRWPLISLTVGLAVRSAVAEVVGDTADLLIKWPNDIYLDGRKLGGILIEVPATRRDRLIIGIGLNVNNSLSTAPAELRDHAISLCDTQPEPIDREDLLLEILRCLETNLTRLAGADESLNEEFNTYSLLTGCDVAVDDGARRIVGQCRGIDADGALLVDDDAGTSRCFGGVVVEFSLRAAQNFHEPERPSDAD